MLIHAYCSYASYLHPFDTPHGKRMLKVGHSRMGCLKKSELDSYAAAPIALAYLPRSASQIYGFRFTFRKPPVSYEISYKRLIEKVRILVLHIER